MPRGAWGGSSPRPGAGRRRGPVRGGPPAAAGPALRWGCASGPAWHRRPAAASRGREPAPLEPVTAALSPSGGKAAAAAGPGGGGRRRRWGGAGLRGRRASAGLRRRGGPGPGGGCLRDWARAAAPPGAVCRGRWLGFGAAAAPFLSAPRPFGVWKKHTHTRPAAPRGLLFGAAHLWASVASVPGAAATTPAGQRRESAANLLSPCETRIAGKSVPSAGEGQGEEQYHHWYTVWCFYCNTSYALFW